MPEADQDSKAQGVGPRAKGNTGAYPINSLELKLIGKLINEPDSTLKEAASSLGKSIQWTSKKTGQFIDSHVVNHKLSVRYDILPVRQFEMFIGIEEKDNLSGLLEVFVETPFVSHIRIHLTGQWRSSIGFLVPNSSFHVNMLLSLPERLANTSIATQLWDITSSGSITCLDYFDTKIKSWDVPWEILQLELNRIYVDEIADFMLPLTTPHRRFDGYLDSIDLDIMNCVLKGNKTVAEVRSSLGIAQNTASSKLRALRKNGFIEQSYHLGNIDITERVIIWSDEQKATQSLEVWLRRVPTVHIMKTLSNRSIFHLRLPTGGAFGLSEAIGSRMPLVNIVPVITHHSKEVFLPTGLWDSDQQTWKPSLEVWSKIEHLLSQLNC